MRMKRLTSTCLLSMMFVMTIVARDFKYNGIKYTVLDEDSKTCRTASGENGSPRGNYVEGDLVLPEIVFDGEDAYTLTAISSYGFFQNDMLKSVIIPNTVTRIGEGAFSGCLMLQRVVLSDKVEEIEMATFNGCNRLTDIKLPDGLKSIGFHSFQSCAFTKIYIPQSVTVIDPQAFSYSGLAEVFIDGEVERIGYEAFHPTAIQKMYVNSTIPPRIEDIFSGNDAFYQKIIIYVPAGSENAYKSDEQWGRFLNIVPIDFSSIDGVSVDEATEMLKVEVRNGEVSFPGLAADERIDVYSMDGRMVYGGTNRPVSLPKGLYLARAKGVVVKVAVR